MVSFPFLSFLHAERNDPQARFLSSCSVPTPHGERKERKLTGIGTNGKERERKETNHTTAHHTTEDRHSHNNSPYLQPLHTKARAKKKKEEGKRSLFFLFFECPAHCILPFGVIHHGSFPTLLERTPTRQKERENTAAGLKKLTEQNTTEKATQPKVVTTFHKQKPGKKKRATSVAKK